MEQQEENLIIPIPSLVATLWRREQDKGAPLTEDEVISIRDICSCRVATLEAFGRVRERRGYDDIDPEDCWNGWQRARIGLIEYAKSKGGSAWPNEAPPKVPSLDEVDTKEFRRTYEEMAREIVERTAPNRRWMRFGIPVILIGLFLLVATWNWRGGSIGRYGFHPTIMSLMVVFLGAQMVYRGMRG